MFRTLAISLVLVLVTGAANIEGKANQEQDEPQQQLHVRVYDYAQVSPEVLAEAKSGQFDLPKDWRGNSLVRSFLEWQRGET